MDTVHGTVKQNGMGGYGRAEGMGGQWDRRAVRWEGKRNGRAVGWQGRGVGGLEGKRSAMYHKLLEHQP